MGAFEFSMWGAGMAIPTLFAVGAMLMVAPTNQFLGARSCFWASALLTLGVAAMWGAQSNLDFLVRAGVCAVFATTATIGLMEALRWVKHAEVSARAVTAQELPGGKGGAGGSGAITDGNGVVVGGRGGRGGPPGAGDGGAGGSGTITGGTGIIIGGDGGEAGQPDGQGGRGGRSPLERAKELGLTSPGLEMAETIAKLRNEYLLSHDGLSAAIIAGTEPIPDAWMNKRLKEMNLPWHYVGKPGGYELTRVSDK